MRQVYEARGRDLTDESKKKAMLERIRKLRSTLTGFMGRKGVIERSRRKSYRPRSRRGKA